MNVERIIRKLSEKYPRKKIIKNREENPTEIICEVEPGLAVAVIDKSITHYHKKTTEIYEIIKGELTVYKDGKGYKLGEGDNLTIKPEEVHYAVGNEAWAKVYSEPPWTQEDHIIKQ